MGGEFLVFLQHFEVANDLILKDCSSDQQHIEWYKAIMGVVG